MVYIAQGDRHRGPSTVVKPTDPDEVLVDSEWEETDTEDVYRFNKYGRWEFIPAISLKSKRIQTLFMPNPDQTGLIYGDSAWRGITNQLQNSGCMVHRARTSASESETSVSNGNMELFQFAQVEMLPKIQMVFSFSDTGTNSAAFIGIMDDADTDTSLVTTSGYIPTGVECVGLGYKTVDTNYMVYHNDNAGAVNAVDTGIARDTNVYMIEVEFETATSARVSLFDINMELVYENIFTSEIPVTGRDLAFIAKIQNANTTAQYAINMFDYVILEKTRPPLSATIDA